MPDHNQEVYSLTRDDVKKLISEGVTDAMTRLGVDADNPLEMQRDFQYLRDWRLSALSVRKKSLWVITGTFLTAMGGALLLGLKTLFNS
jgi:hypothetical protein